MPDDKITEGIRVLLFRWVGLPAAGALVAWLLKLLAGWLVTLPKVLFRGPLEFVDSIATLWVVLGGLVVGFVLSLMWHGERLAVVVSQEQVRLKGDEYEATFDRGDVAAVFADRQHLVLLGHDTGELARRTSELDVAALKTAFTRHGYPWHDGDPHSSEYRRWVPDMEGLPPGANALLAARAEARDDEELRTELLRLGVVVRDDKKKQYWRLVP